MIVTSFASCSKAWVTPCVIEFQSEYTSPSIPSTKTINCEQSGAANSRSVPPVGFFDAFFFVLIADLSRSANDGRFVFRPRRLGISSFRPRRCSGTYCAKPHDRVRRAQSRELGFVCTHGRGTGRQSGIHRASAAVGAIAEQGAAAQPLGRGFVLFS